jgi:hypothetical protein
MLRITVELVPGGFEPQRRSIATMRIANVSALADVSDYVVEAMEGENPPAGSPPRSAVFEVPAHDRRQPVWALLARAAAAAAEADWVEF